MPKRKKVFLVSFAVLIVLTLVVGRMAANDNEGPVTQSWQPTILLKRFNSDEHCQRVNYDVFNTSCQAALGDEDWLVDVLLVIDLVFVGVGVTYIGKSWYRKKTRRSL